MKESDQTWLSLFLVTCAFWLMTSGAINLDVQQYGNPQIGPNPEASRVAQLVAQK